MPDWLWAAFAFVLIVEGILPFVSPRMWREAFRRLIELSDGQIRFVGLTALVIGIAVLTLTGYA